MSSKQWQALIPYDWCTFKKRKAVYENRHAENECHEAGIGLMQLQAKRTKD